MRLHNEFDSENQLTIGFLFFATTLLAGYIALVMQVAPDGQATRLSILTFIIFGGVMLFGFDSGSDPKSGLPKLELRKRLWAALLVGMLGSATILILTYSPF